MRVIKTRRVFDHLGRADGVDALLPHAERLLALKRMYQEIAPPLLAGVSRVMNLRLGQLVIAANNSGIATKLRQLEPRLKGEFLKKGVNINEIRVEVQAKPPVWQEWEKSLTKQPRNISVRGQKALANLTGELQDSPLKQALAKILEKE